MPIFLAVVGILGSYVVTALLVSAVIFWDEVKKLLAIIAAVILIAVLIIVGLVAFTAVEVDTVVVLGLNYGQLILFGTLIVLAAWMLMPGELEWAIKKTFEFLEYVLEKAVELGTGVIKSVASGLGLPLILGIGAGLYLYTNRRDPKPRPAGEGT